MKKFNQIITWVILLSVLLVSAVNIYMRNLLGADNPRHYQVEINRLQMEIRENGIDNISFLNYSYVKNVEMLPQNATERQKEDFFSPVNLDYSIRYIGGICYRFDYIHQQAGQSTSMFLAVNIGMVIPLLFIILFLFYLRIQLIKPFNKISDLPYQLSKGNLTIGITETKSRFFGRFIWGLNLLRESLEEQHQKELFLQKEKKTLILSISHDIKTPLSAIKLYSQALSKNLYDTDEKKQEIAEVINKKADEIEHFISDIIQASSNDFLKLEVCKGEFYMEKLINSIRSYYSPKLAFNKTEFQIEKYDNNLITGDFDRVVEVIQNVMENAIKYGDGRRIDISFNSEEDCKLVTISNSGCTLLPSELPYLFDSFWRGSNVQSKSGNGLGLYICRQLLHKMDGDIYAECVDTEMRVTIVLRMI